MNILQRHIALFLLLLFVRVLVPDGFMLVLHNHAHTAHDATELVKLHPDAAKVDTAHLHCPIEKLFGAPYQASFCLYDLTQLTHTATYAEAGTATSQRLPLTQAYLRGPPVA